MNQCLLLVVNSWLNRLNVVAEKAAMEPFHYEFVKSHDNGVKTTDKMNLIVTCLSCVTLRCGVQYAAEFDKRLRMKKLTTLMFLATCFAAFAQNEQQVPKSSDITFDKAAASYAIGYRMGLQMAGREGSGFEVDIEQAVKGLREAASQKEPTVDKEKMAQEYGKYQQKLQLFQREEYLAMAAKNQKRSDDFLAQNRSKTGIKELASGIQYRIIEAGKGKNASLDDTVSVHYSGKLIGTEVFDNYQEFDSTYKNGQPLEMDMTKVGLPGWREIIPMMKAGDKWQVFLPPEMAYGVKGQGPIGPNEVLVFDVHLLEIK